MVKILLGDIEAGWRRVLRELAGENNQLEIIGEVKQAIDILLQAKKASADVVVLPQEIHGREPGICSHLLLEYPNLVVLLVPSNGGPNVLCRMVLYREIRDASKESLRIMLRKLDPE